MVGPRVPRRPTRYTRDRLLSGILQSAREGLGVNPGSIATYCLDGRRCTISIKTTLHHKAFDSLFILALGDEQRGPILLPSALDGVPPIHVRLLSVVVMSPLQQGGV
jgi:hypothetical protein